jgi:hypothetical protein
MNHSEITSTFLVFTNEKVADTRQGPGNRVNDTGTGEERTGNSILEPHGDGVHVYSRQSCSRDDREPAIENVFRIILLLDLLEARIV